MYAAYFGLKQEPFSIAPDPRLLFMSERHKEALAHLLFGVRGGGGFVLLTGEVGTGKTTVCRSFLGQVPPNCNLAYIFNPKLTVLELLETICHEFGVPMPVKDQPTVKDYLDPLNDFLLKAHAQGRNNLLVIDEAQNLSANVLEQLRLLTNLETSERKLLQIILIGQPELRDMLARPQLEQLAQRVVARYHLGPLAESQTAQYVRHRMEACGLRRPVPFSRRALRRVHQLTAGVPRRINLLCDRALLGAFATGQSQVSTAVIDRAAREVFATARAKQGHGARPAFVLALGIAMGVGLLVLVQQHVLQPQQEPAVALLPAAKAKPAAQAAVAVAGPVGPAVAPSQAAASAAVVPVAAASAAAASSGPPQLLQDEAEAWRELAQVWKLAAPAQGDPCEAWQSGRVQCYSRQLNLGVVRQLDRPGIVMLDADTAKPSYAVLVHLTDTSATLRAAGTEQTVTLVALAQRWQGHFATLWHSPAGYDQKLVRGSAIQWLAAQLAVANGEPALAGKSRMDDRLTTAIRSFQMAQGLPVDGAAGPMTYMQLNRVAGIDEPRLRKAP